MLVSTAVCPPPTALGGLGFDFSSPESVPGSVVGLGGGAVGAALGCSLGSTGCAGGFLG